MYNEFLLRSEFVHRCSVIRIKFRFCELWLTCRSCHELKLSDRRVPKMKNETAELQLVDAFALRMSNYYHPAVSTELCGYPPPPKLLQYDGQKD